MFDEPEIEAIEGTFENQTVCMLSTPEDNGEWLLSTASMNTEHWV